jgi:hypothetical protein
MASLRPSASSARAFLALPLLLAGTLPARAEAGGSSCCPNRAAQISSDDALERLRAARKRQGEQDAQRGPTSIPKPSDDMRRRAFDGLHRRAPSPELEARARTAHDKASAGLVQEREQMAGRIGQALGLEAPDVEAIAGAAKAPAKPSWVPVVFVSSSMPVTTLRSYAAQLEPVRGVLAFRGMPGGLTRVAPMAKLVAEILRLDPGCEGPACAMRDVQLIVDPLIFRQHGVREVPALTMAPGDPARPYCEREEASERGRHLVLGDAALAGMLEEYARLGGKEEVRDAAARIENR